MKNRQDKRTNTEKGITVFVDVDNFGLYAKHAAIPFGACEPAG